MRTVCNKAVYERLLALKEKLIQDSFPVVTVEYELILKEIDVGTLVPITAQQTMPSFPMSCTLYNGSPR